jgi:hypothetical protein
MRYSAVLVLAALAGILAPLPSTRFALAEGKATRPDIMSVKDIRPGMKGYGLTVFEGTKPERFDVEVIGVLDNFQPRQELVLIKTRHPRLDVAKVVAGMSGSPIFINNKMIGAYAYGWSFGSEPVAGVTPIRNMLDELMRPLPDIIQGWPLKGLPKANNDRRSTMNWRRPNFSDDQYGGLVKYDLLRHAGEVAARTPFAVQSALAPVATPLLVGGLNPGAVDLAKKLLSPMGLEPLQAGGSGTTDPTAPEHYENGSAIGVELIRGDMSAMGLGTVTRVEGNRLVAFGHPMMQSGVTALPTSLGRVLWFLASDMRSFKIGMPVRSLGALVNDRQASIVVSETAKAPLIPVTMNIKGVPGAPHTKWQFEVSHEKFMTPAFMSVALGNALQATASERQDVSWSATSRLKVRGYGDVTLEDFGVAIGGTPEAQDFIRSNLVDAVGGLLNNPWEPVVIERADMQIELRFAREILRLRGVELFDPQVEAGNPARIRLTLVPYVGPAVTRVVSIPIPAHLAGQSVELRIGPGYEEERDVADPENVPELIRNLENPVYPPKSIVITYKDGASAVSYKGRVAKTLPPGALDAIRPTTSSLAPDAFRSEAHVVVDIGKYVVGRDRVSVTVKPVLR